MTDDLFYEDEDERAERLAIQEEGSDPEELELSSEELDEPEEEPITDEEYESFKKQIAQARHILETKGRLSGMCIDCSGTGIRQVLNEDGYEGFQYKIDNEIPVPVKCNHGIDISERMPF